MTITGLTPGADGWEERVQERVRVLGFTTVEAFVRSHPAEPYHKLAERLGPDVAALQIIHLYREELRGGIPVCVQNLARDVMARTIRHRVKRGWGRGMHREYNRAGAYAECSSILSDLTGTDHTEPCRVAFDALAALDPSDDWVPTTPCDTFLIKAAEAGWAASHS